MIFSIISKVTGLVAILWLIVCISALYRAFERAQPRDKSSIAWGLIFETIFMAVIAVRIITG